MITYSGLVKAEGKSHKNWSLHGWGGAGFVEGPVNTPGVKDNQVQILSEFAKHFNTPALVGQELTVFRVAKAFKENTARLRVAYPSSGAQTEIPKVVNSILIHLCKADRKAGDAPMGPQERELRACFKLNERDQNSGLV